MLFDLFPLPHQPAITSVSVPFLPVEICRLIVEEVDTPSDLHTLLFVNKALQSESERIIYREITIKYQPLQARLSLFKHLSNCQRVALHVRKLSLFGLEGNRLGGEKYFRAFHQALCALHLLKDLYLENYPNRGARLGPSFSLLSDCKFQLRTLSMLSDRRHARPAFEDQKTIEELHLMGASWDPLPQVVFSRLSILSCDAPLNPEFIKGVKALHVARDEYLKPIVSNQSRFVNLVSLRVSSIHWPWDIDIAIPLMFPSVQYVQLHYYYCNLARIQRLMDDFQRLLKLQKVHLTGLRKIVPDQSVVSHWFYKIRSLQSIIIQTNAMDHVEWIRGAEHPVGILPNEDEWQDRRWIP